MSVQRRIAIAITVLVVLIIITGVIGALTDAGAVWFLEVVLIAAAVSLMLRALRTEHTERRREAEEEIARDAAEREAAWQRALAESDDLTDLRGRSGGSDPDHPAGT